MSAIFKEYRSISRAVYNEFCKKYPDLDLPYKEWKEILLAYNKGFRNYMLDTGEMAKLPWGLGSFVISKKRPVRTKTKDGIEYTNLAIDWPKSKKAGKVIYNLNTHTDGYRFRWLWSSKSARGIPHHDTWYFKPNREASRTIAVYLKKPGSSYSQLYKEWERNRIR